MEDKRNQKEIKYLYRYQPFNGYSKDIFLDNKLYFACPSEFNDPFDCKALFSLRDIDEKDFRIFLTRLFENRCPNIPRDAVIQKVDETIKKGFYWDINWLRKHGEKFREILEMEVSKLGVLCLSEKQDDILMWSHYADKHKGFVLQFDKSRIDSWRYCSPVIYQGQYPTFKEFIPLIHRLDLHKLFLLRKSKHWDYEHEWRVIIDLGDEFNNEERRKIKFPENVMTGVIFGCQMQDLDRGRIRLWLKDKMENIKLYQAVKKEDEFALKIEPIE